jgi:hypothetical protein
LIKQIAERCWKVRQGHPNEKESAKGVQLWFSLQPTDPQNWQGNLGDSDRHAGYRSPSR